MRFRKLPRRVRRMLPGAFFVGLLFLGPPPAPGQSEPAEVAREVLAGLDLEAKVGQVLAPRAPAEFRHEGDPERRALLAPRRVGADRGRGGVRRDPGRHPRDDRGAPERGAAAAPDRGRLRVGNGDADRRRHPLPPGDAGRRRPRPRVAGAPGPHRGPRGRARSASTWCSPPVLDVLRSPESAVIGTRSYGADPELVAPARRRLPARRRGGRRAGDREALPRTRRHRDRQPLRARHRPRLPRTPRGGGPRPVPGRRGSRGLGNHARPPGGSRTRRAGRPPGHPLPGDPRRGAPLRDGLFRPGGQRRPRHGGGRAPAASTGRWPPRRSPAGVDLILGAEGPGGRPPVAGPAPSAPAGSPPPGSTRRCSGCWRRRRGSGCSGTGGPPDGSGRLSATPKTAPSRNRSSPAA